MQPFSSPRLPAFLTLMRDFQKALLPRATSLLRSFEPPAEVPDASFQFALGSSSHPHLARAVVECITQIKAQLGPWRAPDLCQLFVTSGAYSGDHIRFAPSVSTCPASPAHVWLANCEKGYATHNHSDNFLSCSMCRSACQGSCESLRSSLEASCRCCFTCTISWPMSGMQRVREAGAAGAECC